MRSALVIGFIGAVLPCAAWPHSFDERYDLPAPLAYFVAGAALTVALSFAVAAVFARSAPPRSAAEHRIDVPGPWLPALRAICRALGVAVLALTLAAAWFGSGDPQMNFAPTLIWIVWWVGLSLACACIGNLWPALDPWRSLFDAADALARRLGRPQGIALGWRYPRALGAWPAVALLLAWAWLEVVYPIATVPRNVAWAGLAWSVLTLTGMACFGRDIWQENADVFAVYFSILGRFAPLASGPRSLTLRAPGRGLIATGAASAAMTGFAIAMLATVLFDGLRGGAGWLVIENALGRWLPWLADPNGLFAGTVGLVGMWLAFFAAYAITCLATARLAGRVSAGTIAQQFALTLVPIAVAYNVAHNFSSLAVRSQSVIALASDPFGRRWDLFGTAGFSPDIGLVDARLTWYVAIGAIVAGHVIAVWLAHRTALREFAATGRARLASAPLTVLMVVYTAISLSVIAEPLVKFDPAATDAAGGR
jgi:hypothetical protein